MNVWRAFSVLLRICAIALILGSPWIRPRLRPSAARAVVFVVDRSASVGDDGLNEANLYLMKAWHERGNAQLGVVAFDGAAEVLTTLGGSSPPWVRMGAEPNASDIAGGLRLARAMLPRDGHRTIVLLTDMHATRGDAVREAREAADAGIRVDVVPLEGEKLTLPLVVSAKARTTHVAEEQPVALDVELLTDQSFTVEWKRDGIAMPRHEEYLRYTHGDAISRHVELLDAHPPPGVHVYEVAARPMHHRRSQEAPGGPSVRTAVTVDGKAQAIVFSGFGDVSPSLRAALKEIGLEPRHVPLDQVSNPETWASADLVVLEDTRVSAAKTDDAGLTRDVQTSFVDWVSHGGGLLVTGGVFGLAPEVSGTPLARILPVEIQDRGHVEDPPVALAIMLDRSGSMMAMVGDHTKLELALEASLASADVLRPTDLVALASVDTESTWNIPLGPVSRVDELRETVRRVEPGGGGIYVYTALRDAYKALAHVKMPVRHVILFSDTSDSEEQSEGCEMEPCHGKTAESLAREARAKGITTTVVGIGEESASDTPFLRRLAAAAGGRFYLTQEGTDLRRIFLSETRVLSQSNLRQKKAAVVRGGDHPVLEGVDTQKLPGLGAWVETKPRAGADNALLLADGQAEARPLVATWRYGLGKVGVVATDLTEGWGDSMGASPEAAQVLRQTLRFLLRQKNASRADTTVRLADRTFEVEFELPPDAPESAAPTSVDVRAIGPDGEARTVPVTLEPRGPGRFVARGARKGESIVIARARDARGAIVGEAVGRRDDAAELVSATPDAHAAEELAAAGGGRSGASPSQVLEPTAMPAKKLDPLWPYALVAAAVLVALDLVLRRLGERRSVLPDAERQLHLAGGGGGGAGL